LSDADNDNNEDEDESLIEMQLSKLDS
jgi:hypothetical protein